MHLSPNVDLPTLLLSTTTDANGWTVYDYGFKKVATKTTTNAEIKVRFEVSTRASNLPVGVTTFSQLKTVNARIDVGTNSDFVTLTRCNSNPASTSITYAYMFLGSTGATSYTIPITMTVEW